MVNVTNSFGIRYYQRAHNRPWGTCKRDHAKSADYILFYKPHIPLAVVEAKDNNHAIGDGMQQAMDYAQRMFIPFVFTSNGDGFTFYNRIDSSEMVIALDEFPSPETLWNVYKQKERIDLQQEKIVMQPYYLEREDKPPRYYQLNAVNKTVDAIMRGQSRVLLVMATGLHPLERFEKGWSACMEVWK